MQEPSTHTRSWPWLVAGVAAFAAALVLFYFGAAMAFFVPGDIGEAYFQ
jgi:hypothetical protein